MHVIIIGAGIIGAALACRLARAGANVTVLEAGQGPGGGATGASFGWLNASFYADEAHFHLRAAGLKAWANLAEDVALPELTWSGALWYEEQGAGMDRMEEALGRLVYPVARLDRAALRGQEPGLREVPEAALAFEAEGVAEPAAAARRLLDAAQAAGAQVLYGARVEAVAPGRVTLAQGVLKADQVVVAAGTGAETLLGGAGHTVPMLTRPGILLRTAPVPPLLSHILVSPEGEIRQDAVGRVVMPTAANHQGDTSETVGVMTEVAEAAMARLDRVVVLPDDVSWSEAALGWRPVPQDGLPVVGALEDGLYVTVMHSGMTLAAVVADLAAAEITGRGSNAAGLLDPYRPGRFVGLTG